MENSRPKKRQERNSEDYIVSTSKKVLDTNYEKRKIELLTSFEGVAIPTASALLTLIDPNNYVFGLHI